MRRFISLLVLVTGSAASIACEDGPNQVFVPAPAGAAANWNNGQSPGVVGSATQSFPTLQGGQQGICSSADIQQQRWNVMLREPIVPPQFGAGLDMAGGYSWMGLTVNQAEHINCWATSTGDFLGDGDLDVAWGNHQEVIVEYLASTLKIDALTFRQGYLGAVGCTGMEPNPPDSPSQPPGMPCTQMVTSSASRWGMHTYSVPVGSQLTKDGAPFTLDWVGTDGFGRGAIVDEVDQLASAIYSSYFEGLPEIDNCVEVGLCGVNHFGDQAYFTIAPTGFEAVFASYTSGPEVASTPAYSTLRLSRVLPYSFNNPLLKLDAEGPTAVVGSSTGVLGMALAPCVLGLGMDYADFVADCVNVTGDPMKDQNELNEVLGGIQHDAETFTFNLTGLAVDFASSSLPSNAVLTDGMLPQSGDKTRSFSVDGSTAGSILNDFVDPFGQNRDLHGAGAVYREYARSVIYDLQAAAGLPNPGQYADSDCLIDDGAARATNPTAWATHLHAAFPHCTGFEGMLTATPATVPFANAYRDIGTALVNIDPLLDIGLKPGATHVTFCADANGVGGLSPGGGPGTGYNLCGFGADPGFGMAGDIFSASLNRAIQVFGNGSVTHLPPDAQDRHFFFREYVMAAIRYFIAHDPFGTAYASQDPVADLCIFNPGAANADPQGCTSGFDLDRNGLSFETIGAGQFETGEYVDRRFATATRAPLTLFASADVLDGIFNDWQFDRYLYRGESAFYGALTPTTSGASGSLDTAVLTNAFGNPILAQWPGGATTASPYQCATQSVPGFPNYDAAIAADCAAAGSGAPTRGTTGLPLLDDNGALLLTAYAGAVPSVPSSTTPGSFVAQTVFSLTCSGGVSCPTALRVLSTDGSLQQAMVQVPTFANPNDPTSVPGTPIQELTSWTSAQPGVGFDVPINGGTSFFVQASLIDFSGTTMSLPVYYDCALDPTTHQCAADGSLEIEGVVSRNFLGRVFLCQDGQDILGAEMSTPAGEILAWIEAHPSVYANGDSCQMVLAYSPFNNALASVASLANGVSLAIAQSSGVGRVGGVTLFRPGQLGIGQ